MDRTSFKEFLLSMVLATCLMLKIVKKSLKYLKVVEGFDCFYSNDLFPYMIVVKDEVGLILPLNASIYAE